MPCSGPERTAKGGETMRNAGAARHVILSGCSGGGKSTLLAALAARGFATVAEPGRRIVAEEMQGDGKALPWVDLEAFARRAFAMASEDRRRHEKAARWVFFDRGMIDAAVALQQATGIAASATLRGTARYHRQVFLTPPWPEIYRTDAERPQGLDAGIAEYRRLLIGFDRLGYETIILPKADVGARADFVLDCLC
jgi:predicted ATPase